MWYWRTSFSSRVSCSSSSAWCSSSAASGPLAGTPPCPPHTTPTASAATPPTRASAGAPPPLCTALSLPAPLPARSVTCAHAPAEGNPGGTAAKAGARCECASQARGCDASAPDPHWGQLCDWGADTKHAERVWRAVSQPACLASRRRSCCRVPASCRRQACAPAESADR